MNKRTDNSSTQEHFDDLLEQSLGPICLGLSFIYLSYAFGHRYILSPEVQKIMTPYASTSAVLFFLLFIFSKPILQKTNVNVFAFIIGIYAAVEASVHMFLASQLLQTMNLVFVLLGVSCFMFSWPIFLTFLSATWMLFGFASQSIGTSNQSVPYSLLMFSGTVLSYLIFTLRIKTHGELRNASLDQHKSRVLEHLAGTLANELAIPLSTTAIASKLILDNLTLAQPKLDEVKRAAERVNTSTEKMSKLIYQLKLFASGKTEKGPRQEVNLNKVVQSACLMLKNFLNESRIKVEIVPSHFEPLVLGHSPDIFVAISHLIRNSIEAIKEKTESPWIKFEFGLLPEYVFLEISDCGGGIPNEIASNMFDPLFTTKSLSSGTTGLGLSIAQSIITSYGGKIVYDPSRTNTTFRVQFKREITIEQHTEKAIAA